MWCERIVRNLAEGDAAADGRVIDYVDIEWDQCKSVLKSRTRGGEGVRVLLPSGRRLRHGDVIFEDQRHCIAVNVLPAEMIVVRPPNARTMALLALELGNLHWPTQILENEIIFPSGPLALEAARNLGLQWSIECRAHYTIALRPANSSLLSNCDGPVSARKHAAEADFLCRRSAQPQ